MTKALLHLLGMVFTIGCGVVLCGVLVDPQPGHVSCGVVVGLVTVALYFFAHAVGRFYERLDHPRSRPYCAEQACHRRVDIIGARCSVCIARLRRREATGESS